MILAAYQLALKVIKSEFTVVASLGKNTDKVHLALFNSNNREETSVKVKTVKGVVTHHVRRR
jgi:hypothetical protein